MRSEGVGVTRKSRVPGPSRITTKTSNNFNQAAAALTRCPFFFFFFPSLFDDLRHLQELSPPSPNVENPGEKNLFFNIFLSCCHRTHFKSPDPVRLFPTMTGVDLSRSHVVVDCDWSTHGVFLCN